MRKILLIGVAAAALLAAAPAQADDKGLIIGGTAGAWTGGTIGWFIGGPIGAAIGASTGAAIGASVLSDRDFDYIRADGGADLYVDADLDIGHVVGPDVRIRAVRGDNDYGYFRSNGRIYVVDLDTREIVEIRLG